MDKRLYYGLDSDAPWAPPTGSNRASRPGSTPSSIPVFRAKLKALPTRQNEYGYDPFGFHRDEAKVAALVTQLLLPHLLPRRGARRRERAAPGACCSSSNHSGQLPFDAVGIGGALLFEHDPPRIVRAMVERYVQTVPFVSYLFARWGQITGTPENCRRLLEDEEAILVFPEGAQGISKPFTQRYQLQEFGSASCGWRSRPTRRSCRSRSIGAEEQAPAVNLKPLAKLLGAPAFPVDAAAAVLSDPAATRPSTASTSASRCASTAIPTTTTRSSPRRCCVVRNHIQSMIRVGLKERQHIFW